VSIEVLSLVLGSGLSALQLALAIAQWRDSRHAAPVVTITRTRPDGVVVSVETSDPQALADAVRQLDEV
jgi:hypothetical protein